MSFRDVYSEITEVDCENIRQNVRRWIDETGSRSDLAHALGTSPATISQLLSGKRKITIDWLCAISQATSASVTELISDATPPVETTSIEDLQQQTIARLQVEISRLRDQLNGQQPQHAGLRIGGVIRTNYSDRLYRITGIDHCTCCPDCTYHESLELTTEELDALPRMRPHVHLQLADAKTGDGGAILNNYCPRTLLSTEPQSCDRILIIK